MPAVAFIGAALLVCLARGPRETGWIGWSGGWAIRRDDLPSSEKSGKTEAADEAQRGEEGEGRREGGEAVVVMELGKNMNTNTAEHRDGDGGDGVNSR